MLDTYKIFDDLSGKVLPKQSLAPYTSWRVGGKADLVYVPSSIEDVCEFLRRLSLEIPLLWLGLGSNTLIRDGGVEGVAIITQGALNGIEQKDSFIVRAEAGVSCAQIARHTARLGLKGLEFMAGIPGTVGGALTMNAGCYGGETWQKVCKVETVNRLGQKLLRPASEFQVSYRHVEKPSNEWFVAGYFELEAGDKKESLESIRLLLEKRNLSQPTSWPNCGSVFRNPPGDFAARLIEKSGLKGMSIGDAQVSEKHANFIINQGNATATDIESLICYVANKVEELQGIRLKPEVCIIGKE